MKYSLERIFHYKHFILLKFYVFGTTSPMLALLFLGLFPIFHFRQKYLINCRGEREKIIFHETKQIQINN